RRGLDYLGEGRGLGRAVVHHRVGRVLAGGGALWPRLRDRERLPSLPTTFTSPTACSAARRRRTATANPSSARWSRARRRGEARSRRSRPCAASRSWPTTASPLASCGATARASQRC